MVYFTEAPVFTARRLGSNFVPETICMGNPVRS